MILLFAVFFSLLVALIRGGKLGNLQTLPFRYGWVALLAFALQLVLMRYPLPATEGMLGTRTLLLLGSYGLLVGVVWANRGLPGLYLLGAGLLLNLAVMVANGGFMPVTPEALQQAGLTHLALGAEAGSRVAAAKDIILPRVDTHLWVLSDIFILAPPVGTAFSLGDLFLALGGFVFFQRTLVKAPGGPDAPAESPA
jgi:hypothetical protein